MLTPWLGWSFVACNGDGEKLRPSPAEVVDGSTVVGFEALGGAGDAPYRAQVRTLNAWGASVAASDTTLTVDGEERPVLFDALGYGGVTISAPGLHAVAIDGGDPAPVHVFPEPWPGFGAAPAFPAPVAAIDEVFGVTDGLVGRVGPELWFTGGETPAHRVLRADGDLIGARAANVDVDGRIDLIAWTVSEVFVLRGHTGGGFGWGTAFRAPGLTVAGADVGDLTGDNLPDLAIAWVGGDGGGILDVWEAVGVFRFEGAEPRNLPGKPTSIVVSDANADGVAQVTVLHDDSTWSRWIRGAEKQYVPVGPSLPDAIAVGPASSLLPCGDANGDGASELVLAGPYDAAADRSFSFVDIDTDALECAAGLTGFQCLTEFVRIDGLLGGQVACADGDADRVDELWAWDLEEGLRVYQHDPLTDEYRTERIDHPFGDGWFAMSDRDGDGIADPIVADDLVWSQRFGATPSDAEGLWSVRPERTWKVREDVYGPFAQVETDANPGTLEWVTTTSNSSGTYLRLVQYLPFADGSPILGDARLDEVGAVIDDLAVCGTDVYVAIGGAAVRVSIANPADPQVVAQGGVDIARIACGAGPGGVAVVTVTSAGLGEVRNAALATVQAVPGTVGDAIFADLGAGPTLVTCPTAGCAVAAWRYGPAVAVATGDEVGLTLTDAAGTLLATLPGAGVPQAVDVDGDGREDLAAWDRSRRRLTVVRSTGADLAPPSLFDLEEDYRQLTFADGDLDGVPDLFGTDEAEELVHTLLAPPPPQTTPTGAGT